MLHRSLRLPASVPQRPKSARAPARLGIDVGMTSWLSLFLDAQTIMLASMNALTARVTPAKVVEVRARARARIALENARARAPASRSRTRASVADRCFEAKTIHRDASRLYRRFATRRERRRARRTTDGEDNYYTRRFDVPTREARWSCARVRAKKAQRGRRSRRRSR